MIQYRNGEIFIGGLIRVHKRGEREHCAGIQQDGVEAVEAMNEVLDKVIYQWCYLMQVVTYQIIINR